MPAHLDEIFLRLRGELERCAPPLVARTGTVAGKDD